MAESTEAVLEELERRRRDRWLVAALLLVAVLGAAGLLLIDDAATRFAPYGIGAFFVVTVAYAISVAAQERRADRAGEGCGYLQHVLVRLARIRRSGHQQRPVGVGERL